MNTRKLLVSVLMLVCVILSSCVPAKATPTVTPTVKVALPTATFVPTPAPPPSDSTALTTLTGVYSYKIGEFASSLLLLSDGSYRGPSSGLFGITADQISFVDGFSCKSGTGVYQWALKDTSLMFTLVQDDCQNRVDFFSKTVFEKAVENKTSAYVIWAISQTLSRVATDPNGNVYAQVEYYRVSYFSEFDASGKPLGDWHNGIADPTGIAIDSHGNIYVADFGNAVIQKFDSNKKPLLSWTVDAGKIGPTGIAVDAQGNVYVALHRIHDHYIEKYDPQGKLLGTWAKPVSAGGEVVAGDHSGPESLGVNGNGNTYLGNLPTVIKYGPNGDFLHTFTDVVGIAVDSQGNFYTGDSDQNILKFDSSGKQIGKWSLPFEGRVEGIDKDSNILIVCFNNSMLAKVKLPEQ